MFRHTPAFSGFSVNDIPAATGFYGDILGLQISEENGMLRLHIAGAQPVLVYPKPNHVPATYTVHRPQLSGERCERRGGRAHGPRGQV